MKCINCEDWKENIGKVDGPIVFIETTRPYMSYGKVKQFIFCPWCGHELVEDENKE